ncbi:hypothetical protein MVEN_00630000 [Mycena venus]|uniref:Uncharacterized protein n=1 Tax=Mycena venus TaxID=2733690 RepID=A0A8H7D7Z7_9AGAR|nr:hypothetical protein MVEN_00630000 [Mycena venus]
MPSTHLTANDQDILNTTLTAIDGTVQYTIMTQMKIFGRRDPTHVVARSGQEGIIDWREKTIRIGQNERPVAYLKQHRGGMFSSKRQWSWTDIAYTVKYEDNRDWTATPISESVEVARLRSRNEHLFRSSDPAIVWFSEDIPNDTEKMFLLLVLLYSEVRRLDAE